MEQLQMLKTKSRLWSSFALLVLGVITISGCGEAPPEIVPVTGILTCKGNPVGNAEVKFVPMQDGLDGNYSASGVTDRAGKFTLQLPGQSEPGCCACECKVLVVEGPIPGDTRGQDEKSLLAAANFRKSLKNRPIPKQYERVGTSPLSYTVSAETNNFEIELTR
jgi:hypothetical protein